LNHNQFVLTKRGFGLSFFEKYQKYYKKMLYMMVCFLYNYSIKTKQHNQIKKVRRYKMQGSHGDMVERFSGRKVKDSEQIKARKNDRKWRDKRRNRHQDSE
jgi:hypothetical protein